MDKSVMDIRSVNWATVFEAQAASGLNKRDFCKENGIPESGKNGAVWGCFIALRARDVVR